MSCAASPALAASPLPAFSGAVPSVVVPGVVSPDYDFGSCGYPNNTYDFCGWSQSLYTGGFEEWATNVWPHDQWHYIGDPWNDWIVSLYNKRPDSTYVAKNYPPNQPNEICLVAGAAYDNLYNNAWPDGTNAAKSISSFDLQEENDC